MKKCLLITMILGLLLCACTSSKTYELEITENFWKAYRLDWYDDSKLDIFVKEMTKEGDVIEIQKITNLTCDSIGTIIKRNAMPKTAKIMIELDINLNPQGYMRPSYISRYNGLWKSERSISWTTKTLGLT